MPVATLRAMSSPSQVLAHLGAPPITPTDESPQSPSTSQRRVLVLAGNLPHAHDGKRLIHSHGHLHTFTFFLSAGRGCLG